MRADEGSRTQARSAQAFKPRPDTGNGRATAQVDSTHVPHAREEAPSATSAAASVLKGTRKFVLDETTARPYFPRAPNGAGIIQVDWMGGLARHGVV